MIGRVWKKFGSGGSGYIRILKIRFRVYRVLEKSASGGDEKSQVWTGTGIRIRVLDISLFVEVKSAVHVTNQGPFSKVCRNIAVKDSKRHILCISHKRN